MPDDLLTPSIVVAVAGAFAFAPVARHINMSPSAVALTGYPFEFVVASAGTGLGSVHVPAETFSPSAVLVPEVIIALTDLGAFSFSPFVYRKLRAVRAQ